MLKKLLEYNCNLVKLLGLKILRIQATSITRAWSWLLIKKVYGRCFNGGATISPIKVLGVAKTFLKKLSVVRWGS